MAGLYRITFAGQAIATRYSSGATVVKSPRYDPVTNRSTVEIEFDQPLMLVGFTRTKRTPASPEGSGLTDIRMVRMSSESAANQVFTGAWLDSIRRYPWAVLRCMETVGTNEYGRSGSFEAYPYRLKWSDRRRPGMGPLYASTHPGVHGAASWEDLVILARLTRKDLWINVPVNASEEYVDQLARLFKHGDAATGNVGIPDGINLYVEYSNEMWHDHFPQGKWNAQAALDEVHAGATNLNYDGQRDPERWRFRRMAKRTVEIGRQFRNVFSDSPERIRPVLNNQKTVFDFDLLRYVAANYGAPGEVLYGIAQNGYYTSADSSSVDKILEGEMAASDRNQAAYLANRTMATYFGLHSLAYEGGPEETGGADPKVADPGLSNKLAAARDPRMKDVILHDLMANWFPSGGELYVSYTQVSRYGFYGTYGLTEDIADLKTGKWLGYAAAMQADLPAVTAGTLLPLTTGASLEIPVGTEPGVAVKPGPDPWAKVLLRVQRAGNYVLTVQAKAEGPGSRVRFMLDDALAGTAVVNAPISVRLTTGLHALFLFLDSAPGISIGPDTRLRIASAGPDTR